MEYEERAYVALIASLYGDGDPPTEGETVDLAARLRLCNGLVEKCRLTAADLELELAARMESDTVHLSGLGILKREPDERSKWRNESSAEALRHDLREKIAGRMALDRETGERNQAVLATVREAIDTVWDCVPSFSTVKRAGARLGIDMADYRETTEVTRVRIYAEGELT